MKSNPTELNENTIETNDDNSTTNELSVIEEIVIEDDRVLEEDQVMLSVSDIKTICTCMLLIVFIIAMIYEVSRPESLISTVIMFISLVAFILIVISDRD